jgi:hypothetical protein
MPETLWSAPVGPLTGNSSVSPGSATALTDISPMNAVIYGGTLDVGTRIRIRAYGEYTATTTASTIVWSFVMNQVGTAIATTPATLAATAALTASASAAAWPWMLEYEGRMSSITQPGAVGATTSQIVGQGKSYLPTSLTAWTVAPFPITAALRTVAQATTGLVTNVAQIVAVTTTITTATGITNITCDELTVELLG